MLGFKSGVEKRIEGIEKYIGSIDVKKVVTAQEYAVIRSKFNARVISAITGIKIEHDSNDVECSVLSRLPNKKQLCRIMTLVSKFIDDVEDRMAITAEEEEVEKCGVVDPRSGNGSRNTGIPNDTNNINKDEFEKIITDCLNKQLFAEDFFKISLIVEKIRKDDYKSYLLWAGGVMIAVGAIGIGVYFYNRNSDSKPEEIEEVVEEDDDEMIITVDDDSTVIITNDDEDIPNISSSGAVPLIS